MRSAHFGYRPDIGMYVRSGWEANYARYLNLLKEREEIYDWEYEPETFDFPIKRGNTRYTPDFRVWFSEFIYEWNEVKGWLDQDSKVRIKRFKKYYPHEPFRLIDAPVYRKIEAEFASEISEWE